jgi:hypothetical protein
MVVSSSVNNSTEFLFSNKHILARTMICSNMEYIDLQSSAVQQYQ